MKIEFISSNRHFQYWPSWHIVYEWEDEISKALMLPIERSPYNNNVAFKLLNKISLKISKYDYSALIEIFRFQKGKCLCFEMIPKSNHSFSNGLNSIPIIIDYWKYFSVDDFIKYYQKCPVILVSSLEVFGYLNKVCSLKLRHFPLSLPDKYRLDPTTVFDKKYDVLFAGRRNPVFWDYIKIYEKVHPNIEYLYEEHQKGEIFYCSNRKGTIGNFHKREDYFELLKSSKVSFYSTPGIDGGESRTGGFNPVTPRLFESLAAGCHVIARYTENEDTEFFQLNSICPSVNSYEEFELQLKNALEQNEQPVKRNAEYLLNHYTSVRAKRLKNILENE